jgi:hypothetical protein
LASEFRRSLPPLRTGRVRRSDRPAAEPAAAVGTPGRLPARRRADQARLAAQWQRWAYTLWFGTPLAVEPQDVILGQTEPADGGFIIDTGVWPMPVVSMQPGR